MGLVNRWAAQQLLALHIELAAAHSTTSKGQQAHQVLKEAAICVVVCKGLPLPQHLLPLQRSSRLPMSTRLLLQLDVLLLRKCVICRLICVFRSSLCCCS